MSGGHFDRSIYAKCVESQKGDEATSNHPILRLLVYV